ncbi:MAG: tRNA (guanine(46)-N(7))-methyltransferase TrmB [Candidatus Moraniibacteriota bacterium]|jgi:tRNA (guanine-N7-)-methyltransferase
MAKGSRIRHHVNPLSDLTEHEFSGFENNNPIIIDIGADRGEFIEQLLEKFENNKNFIVSEIRKPLARKLEKKFEKHGNVVVFDGDMTRNFENIVRTSIKKNVLIEEIYINFPDPWFKERHKKRRVVNIKFLESIKKWTQKETKWIFQTDQQQLFDETVELLESIDWIGIEFFDESPYGATTKWENAKVEDGFKINRLKFQFV